MYSLWLKLLPVMPCILMLACGSRKISGSWEGASGSKVELDQNLVAQVVIPVTFNETWSQLQPGESYAMEIDGKRLSGWNYVRDGNSCTVSVPTDGNFIELPSPSVTVDPEYVKISQVRKLGDQRTFLRLSGCEFWEKIMYRFDGGGLGYTFSKNESSSSGGSNSGVMYQKLGVGKLKVFGTYRFTKDDELEICVTPASGRELSILQLRLSVDDITVLANDTFIPQDLILHAMSNR